MPLRDRSRSRSRGQSERLQELSERIDKIESGGDHLRYSLANCSLRIEDVSKEFMRLQVRVEALANQKEFGEELWV